MTSANEVSILLSFGIAAMFVCGFLFERANPRKPSTSKREDDTGFWIGYIMGRNDL